MLKLYLGYVLYLHFSSAHFISFYSFVRAKHRHEAMKQFKWTYYSFLGFLASSLISSYLSLLFLCILILVWLRGGDFKMKLDFLLRNWHYPAMSIVLLLAFWNLTPQKLTIEFGLTLFFVVVTPLVVPTLKSLNFTYNKRVFSQFFVWTALVCFLFSAIINWDLIIARISSDSLTFKFLNDIMLRINPLLFQLILVVSAILFLEFFSLKDSKRKNAWKTIQLTLYLMLTLLTHGYFTNFTPFALPFLAYGIKGVFHKDETTRKIAWVWFSLSIFLLIFGFMRFNFLPSTLNRFNFFDLFACSEINCLIRFILLFLPAVLMVLHAFNHKNFAFFTWLITLTIILLPVTQSMNYGSLSFPFYIFLAFILPFMNMLKSDAR